MMQTQTTGAAIRRRATTARPSTGKRPSITELFHRFEKMVAVQDAIPSTQQKRFERGLDRVDELARTIICAPADNLPDMLTKISVVAWFIGTPPKKWEQWKAPTRRMIAGPEELDCLVGLRSDLRRLQRRLRALPNLAKADFLRPTPPGARTR